MSAPHRGVLTAALVLRTTSDGSKIAANRIAGRKAGSANDATSASANGRTDDSRRYKVPGRATDDIRRAGRGRCARLQTEHARAVDLEFQRLIVRGADELSAWNGSGVAAQ